MGPGMGRVVRMAKTDARNDLFNNLQKVLFCPFPDFSGGDRGGRMGHKDGAKAGGHFRSPNDGLDLIRQVDDLLQLGGIDQ